MENINIDNILRNYNDFSFTETLKNLVVNKNFTESYMRNADETGKLKPDPTAESYIWYALSAAGEETGKVIYGNVCDYIDQVSNIDLCKIKALKSMVANLGINYTVFNNTEFLPDEILNAIDVLSINKKYFTPTKDPETDETVYPKVLNTKLLEEINTYLDSEKFPTHTYETYLSSVFYKILEKNIKLKYDYTITEENEIVPDGIFEIVNSDNFICKELSGYFLESNSEKSLGTNLGQFREFKIKNGIPSSFNETKIVDAINNGLDSLDNYSGKEKYLLEMEIELRSDPISVSKPHTRYAYYREQKVKEYVYFIEDKIFNENEVFSLSKYNVNPNYIELQSENKKYLFTLDETQTMLRLDKTMLETAANILKDITITIVKLRDRIKTQVQQNYIKGTFNLLSFIINEYLINFSNIKKFKDEVNAQLKIYGNNDPIWWEYFWDNDGKFPKPKYTRLMENIDKIGENLGSYIREKITNIEYIDTTEYYNLSADTSKDAENSDKINGRFWSEKNNTSLDIPITEIKKYYSNILNVKSDKPNYLDNFLATVYKLGADNSYIDKNTGNPVVKNTNIEKNIFEKYIGNIKYGKVPYLNYKNVTHPSYQVHPYLYNLIEYSKYDSAIKNSFLNDDVNHIIKEITKENITQIIGEYGQTIDLYKTNLNDYSGYKTKYESVGHTDKNILDNFEGAFYEPAVAELVNNKDNAINSVRYRQLYDSNGKTFFHKYYLHLNLTNEEYEDIANKLSSNFDLILAIVKGENNNENNANNKLYDIFKYGVDNLNNHYILYKSYNGNEDLVSNFKLSSPTDSNVSQYVGSYSDYFGNVLCLNTEISSINFVDSNNYKERLNTLGELWIRLDKHPIAFPALYGPNPQINTKDIKINGRFENLAVCSENIEQEKRFEEDKYHMRYFYDMEIDNDYVYLWNSSLTDYRSRFGDSDAWYSHVDENKKYNNLSGVYKFQSIEKSDIIISKVKKEFNSVLNKNELRFLVDDVTKIDTIDNPGIFPSLINNNCIDKTTEYYYKGYFSKNGYKNFVFVKNSENKNNIIIDVLSYLKEIDYQTQTEISIYKYNNEKYNFRDNDTFYYDCMNIGYSNNKMYIPVLISNKPTVNTVLSNIIDGELDISKIKVQNNVEDISYIDRFENDLLVINFDVIQVGNTLEFKHTNDKYYNINTNPSYFPSYPGTSGINILEKSLYIDKEKYKNIQYIGYSQENIETVIKKTEQLYGITEEDPSNLNTYPDSTLSNIIADAWGRIWEDPLSSGLRLEDIISELTQYYTNPVLNTYIDDNYQNNSFTWSTEIGTGTNYFPNINYQYLSNLNIVVFNKNNYGKNPYYVGCISSLIADKEKGVYIYYQKEIENDSDISSDQNDDLFIAGTYNYFNNEVTKLENNHIQYIDCFDINASYGTGNKDHNITIDITLSGKNIPDNYYIPADTLEVILYNKRDMRFYELYHYLDINGFTSADSQELSNVRFDNISALTEIPELIYRDDGYYLHQKIDDGVFFDIGNKYWEFEKYDYKNLFAINPCEVFEARNRYANYTYNTNDKFSEFNILSCIWKDDNLYINRLDDQNVINNIINVSFEIFNKETKENAYRAYEGTYIDENNRVVNFADLMQEYSLNDPRLLQTLKVYESDHLSTDVFYVNLDIAKDIINNPDYINKIASYINQDPNISNNIQSSKTENVRIEWEDRLDYKLAWDEFKNSANDVNKLFNIYGSFKQDASGIVLYFNYINFINSPYVKSIGNGNISMDIIKGTYLKLKPGENGELNIVLQFRLYENKKLIGIENKTVYSYKIFNISDDSPKFLIYNNFTI